MLVYLVHNKVNGKIYIGKTSKTLEVRWKFHCEAARRGSKFYFHVAIRKYGPEAFELALLSSYAESPEQLSEQERYFIAKYRSFDRTVGYNLTMGGDGVKPNAETRRLMGERSGMARRGKPLSKRNRAGIAKAMRELWQTAAFRAKNKVRTGKTNSPIHRQRCAEATRRQWLVQTPSAKPCLLDGIRYGSLIDATKATGLSYKLLRKRVVLCS